ncbi:MAG: DUF5597 domain-containing protein [Chitinophagaceae bacterium]|nr:DUF5597 domain-containing protein [Chitinophagaceae bacterium]
MSFIVLSLALALHGQTGGNNHLYLDKKSGNAQLVVHQKPFLILGGELGNSSASSIEYMMPVWSMLKAMHLNTVLTPVYWELIEPVENKFDFSLLDDAIKNARANDLKLVLLWFGSWKNSMSCYAPDWVKKNQAKFSRAQDAQGKGMEILSAFDNNNLQADVKAFKALMSYIKEVDDEQKTVIMVQVENEVGMLKEAREHTAAADALFQKEVPPELVNYLQQHKNNLVPELRERWAATGFATGNWEKMFGKSLETDEIFQAWYYAKYVGAVAAAGKGVYNIPMYVNAALNYKNVKPGQYPSAGPLPQVMDIWQAGAPAIDMLSPDFYNPYFKQYSELYTRQNNPFFIPEIRFEPDDAAKVFYAIGHSKSIGFSPFSIESTRHPQEEPIVKSYAILEQLSPLITQSGKQEMDGVLLEKNAPEQVVKLGKYEITVKHDFTLGWSPKAKDSVWAMGGGILLHTGEDEFFIAGTGIVCTFKSATPGQETIGILRADEGAFVNDKWTSGRRLNGDETHQGRHIRIPSGEWGIQKVVLYSYK